MNRTTNDAGEAPIPPDVYDRLLSDAQRAKRISEAPCLEPGAAPWTKGEPEKQGFLKMRQPSLKIESLNGCDGYPAESSYCLKK
jgi:hypothetical protein